MNEALQTQMPFPQGYPDHPIAASFPMMDDTTFDEHVEDLRENGQRVPIVIYESAVLDGRNTQKAALAAGLKPIFRRFDPTGDGESPVKFVASHNLKRRDLTPSQKAAAAAELLPFFEAEAKARQVEKLKNVNPSESNSLSLAPIGANDEPSDKRIVDTSGEFSQVRTTANRRNNANGKAATRAAKATGTSERQVERAKRLKADDPEAFEDVKKGRKTLNAALSGKPSPESKAEKEYNDAVERIGKVCGAQQVKGIRENAILRNRRDVIWYAAQSDDKMLAIRSLIDQGWSVKNALNYKAEEINQTHRILDLAWRAMADGDKYSQDVLIRNSGAIARITCEIVTGAAVSKMRVAQDSAKRHAKQKKARNPKKD